MGRLDGQVIIVTGGAQGIGKAYCEGLANEGAKIVVADLNAEAAGAFVRALGEDGKDAMAVTVDVSNPDDAERMARETLARFGRIDGLVNNAAIYQRPGLVPWAIRPDSSGRVGPCDGSEPAGHLPLLPCCGFPYERAGQREDH